MGAGLVLCLMRHFPVVPPLGLGATHLCPLSNLARFSFLSTPRAVQKMWWASLGARHSRGSGKPPAAFQGFRGPASVLARHAAGACGIGTGSARSADRTGQGCRGQEQIEARLAEKGNRIWTFLCNELRIANFSSRKLMKLQGSRLARKLHISEASAIRACGWAIWHPRRTRGSQSFPRVSTFRADAPETRKTGSRCKCPPQALQAVRDSPND